MIPSSPSVDGLLLIDKPAGMTSHDVVMIVRRAYNERSIGHLGTLDPFATGLLVLLLGRCTRLATFIHNEPKEYQATIRFGAETDTDDCTGAIIRETTTLPDRSAIEAAIQQLTGEIQQIPPAYSAKKVDGERAYDMAREGKPVELAPVTITVHAWRIHAMRDDDSNDHTNDYISKRVRELDVTIVCGGGTYIRALARDLGRATHSAAHLTALRRTRSGEFDVTTATTIEQIRSGHFAPVRRLRIVADDIASAPATTPPATTLPATTPTQALETP